ncbi:MAG: prolyl oligopeptidase family serine peptidase [Planctomycetes bacterium]|nr:prolyl oligopeptidase family serine peptidase [Planctomycetota bacterium]
MKDLPRAYSVLFAVLLGPFSPSPPLAPAEAPTAGEVVLGDCLGLAPVGRYGRVPLPVDILQAEMVGGRWKAPKAGDKLALPGGATRTWEATTAKDGAVNHPALRGGYLFWRVKVDAPRVMLLQASGHALAYVNGEPRTGDPYSNSLVSLPIALRKGDNDLLFHVGRGSLRVRLVPPEKPLFLDTRDTTLPDLLEDDSKPGLGAVLVVNATEKTLEGLRLRATAGDAGSFTFLPSLTPLSVRKVGFYLPGGSRARGKVDIRLALIEGKGEATHELSRTTVTVSVPRRDQLHKRTFGSAIDGSVQYYAILPARPLQKNGPPPALFLSLHGAAVEADGQAAAYEAKTWGHLVAPTNRRPFGFDWEDWGRLDAMEVLEHAQKELKTDPQRVYLTGHSMGGHGVWHLGATFPDRFAAIGPSAGWISFWSYGGARQAEKPTPVEALLQRAASPSDTLALARNYAALGVYVLHGDKDDNVPVREARTMKEQLAKFHRDLSYHEQPGAGHWWDASDEPGTDCVDWAPMFDLFARRVLPRREAVRQVDFATASPGVSGWCHWAGIEAQVKQMQPSSVSLRYDPGRRRFTGKTENVARLALDLGHVPPGEPLAVELDGQKFEKIAWPAKTSRVWFERKGENWAQTSHPSPSRKGPHRCGPFKDAFRNRMVFVYGTKGTKEENAWAYAKARYDAETFWYRGNGSVDVVPDTVFDAAKERDRNVIVYGHGDGNAAWKPLLGDSPVQVRRGEVSVDKHTEKGDGLACLFVRPRPGSDTASVGVVAGAGLTGLRLTDRLPYFVSGTGYPDCLVFGVETLTRGSRGVRGAGFFGQDWSVDSGEFVWQER